MAVVQRSLVVAVDDDKVRRRGRQARYSDTFHEITHALDQPSHLNKQPMRHARHTHAGAQQTTLCLSPADMHADALTCAGLMGGC